MYIYYVWIAILIFAFSLRYLVKDAKRNQLIPTPPNLIRGSLIETNWLSPSGIIISLILVFIGMISYRLPPNILQSPLILFLIVIAMLSIMAIFYNVYHGIQSKRHHHRNKEQFTSAIAGLIILVITLITLFISAPHLYQETEHQLTQTTMKNSIGSFYSNNQIENNYANGNDGNHNSIPTKLKINSHEIKGYNKNKLTFAYHIKNYRYEQQRKSLVLNGYFQKKGKWIKRNDLSNSTMIRKHNTILMSIPNNSKIIRIDLCGTNKDYSSPYTPVKESIYDDNEAFKKE